MQQRTCQFVGSIGGLCFCQAIGSSVVVHFILEQENNSILLSFRFLMMIHRLTYVYVYDSVLLPPPILGGTPWQVGAVVVYRVAYKMMPSFQLEDEQKRTATYICVFINEKVPIFVH